MTTIREAIDRYDSETAPARYRRAGLPDGGFLRTMAWKLREWLPYFANTEVKDLRPDSLAFVFEFFARSRSRFRRRAFRSRLRRLFRWAAAAQIVDPHQLPDWIVLKPPPDDV